MTLPFSIGDEVVVTGSDSSGHCDWIGAKFKIERTAGRDGIYYTACGVPLFPASSLRLVEELKIGDLVKIVGPDWADVIRSHDPETAYPIHTKTEAGNFRIIDIGIFPATSLRKLTPGEIQQRVGGIWGQPDSPKNDTPVTTYTIAALREYVASLVDERLSVIEERLGNIDRILGDRWELHTQWRDRISAIESRLDKLGPSHSELMGDVEALAENAGAIEKRLTSIEKRQREQHERMDRFMQDYREHKDFDLDMHDRIKALEGERPEVCELPLTDLGAIAAIASFGPVPECVAAFIRHETEEAEKRKQKGTCDEEDCKPNMKPIRITIQIGKNKVYIMHPETCCPGDALKWCETVLDSMREE